MRSFPQTEERKRQNTTENASEKKQRDSNGIVTRRTQEEKTCGNNLIYNNIRVTSSFVPAVCTYIREARVFLVINWGQKLMALRQIGLRVLSSAGTETETEKTEKTEKTEQQS